MCLLELEIGFDFWFLSLVVKKMQENNIDQIDC